MRWIAVLAILAGLVAGCGAGHPASCKAQYTAWQHGPARPVARSMAGYLSDLDFKGAVPDAQRLEAWPMPTCADPHGYWPQLLRKIVAIGNNSGYGIAYLMEQAQQISALEDKISAELKARKLS